VFGTSGHVRIDNVGEHSAVLSNEHGLHQSRLAHSFPQRFALAFEREMDTFVEVLMEHPRHQLHNPEQPDVNEAMPCWPVTRSQCVHVQRVTDAAIQSFREGRVISLVY
jgi:predicted dehydrogenase